MLGVCSRNDQDVDNFLDIQFGMVVHAKYIQIHVTEFFPEKREIIWGELHNPIAPTT